MGHAALVSNHCPLTSVTPSQYVPDSCIRVVVAFKVWALVAAIAGIMT